MLLHLISVRITLFFNNINKIDSIFKIKMKTTILLWFMLQLVLSEALSPKIMQIVQQKLGNNIIIIFIIKLLHLSIKSNLLNFYIQTTPRLG